jgi:hypothetical protein
MVDQFVLTLTPQSASLSTQSVCATKAFEMGNSHDPPPFPPPAISRSKPSPRTDSSSSLADDLYFYCLLNTIATNSKSSVKEPSSSFVFGPPTEHLPLPNDVMRLIISYIQSSTEILQLRLVCRSFRLLLLEAPLIIRLHLGRTLGSEPLFLHILR